VPVVDGQQDAGAHPGDQLTPRQVAGQPDLDPFPDGQPGDRPVPPAPGQLVVGGRTAGRLLAGRRVHEHQGEPARRDDLGHRARHHVEPLVRDDQHVVEVGQPGGQRGATGGAQPGHGIRQVVGAGHHVDAGEPQVWALPGQVGEQLAAPAPDVDDVVHALAVGQAPDGVGEGRAQGAVGRRREVPGRALGATVEPARAVERVVPCLAPGDHHPRTLSPRPAPGSTR
jgi:hypothetical protein